MRVEDFIEATNAARTPEEVFARYEHALAGIGYDRIMYAAVTDHPVYDHVRSPSVMRNYPEAWIKHYMEKGYNRADPLRRYGPSMRRPFTWVELARRVTFSDVERQVMDEGEEAGLRDGMAVPLHGPYGEVMGVGIASGAGGIDTEHFIPFIHGITSQFHVAYTSLALPELSAGQVARLTRREAEILTWAAAGKSNPVIGEILGISDYCVDYHMRNVLAKLKAENRVMAVVKALRLRLISL